MWQVPKFLSSVLSQHRTDAVHSPPRHAGVTVPTDWMCEDRSAGHDRVQRGTDAHHIAIT